MQKTLFICGGLLLLAGVLWPWLGKLPFGRLPGDIIVERPNFKFYFPITSTLLISGVLSLVLWLLRK